MTWMTIGKRFPFAAAHQLWRSDWSEGVNEDTFGKCARLHGHNYILEVEVSGEVNADTGMVLNYYVLTDIVEKEIISKWDHHHLNEISPFDNGLPTAENLVLVAVRILNRPEIWPAGIILSAVTVKETEKTFARWTR